MNIFAENEQQKLNTSSIKGQTKTAGKDCSFAFVSIDISFSCLGYFLRSILYWLVVSLIPSTIGRTKAMSTLHRIALRTYRYEKLSSKHSKNGNGTELEQVVHTHGTSCLIGWPRGSNLNRHPWIFTSVSVLSNARFYALIYFCCVPKTCSHCEVEWQKPVLWWSIFKIDACRNLHSYVWTE